MTASFRNHSFDFMPCAIRRNLYAGNLKSDGLIVHENGMSSPVVRALCDFTATLPSASAKRFSQRLAMLSGRPFSGVDRGIAATCLNFDSFAGFALNHQTSSVPERGCQWTSC